MTQAIIYRMVLSDHTCPFGLHALELLQAAGYDVDDRLLGTRDEVDAYEREEGVATTPQVFIDGRRIGGSDELQRFLSGDRRSSSRDQHIDPLTDPAPVRRG